jgi:hypothetical protein
MPLNGQLTERGATLLRPPTTAPDYRLYALPGTTPPKPGLQRVAPGEGARHRARSLGMPAAHYGSFVALIPPPLGIGTSELADGSRVQGFICEGAALAGAQDITSHWRLACLHREPRHPFFVRRVLLLLLILDPGASMSTQDQPSAAPPRASLLQAGARAWPCWPRRPSCARRARPRSASATGRWPPACRSSRPWRRATSRKPASTSSRSSSPARSR